MLTQDGQRRELAPGLWLVKWHDGQFDVYRPDEFDVLFEAADDEVAQLNAA